MTPPRHPPGGSGPAAYRGRFAPTPSGDLHFGSLVAALASWLQARSQGGVWLVRIDDLDAPRVVPGAADRILRELEALGLGWDEAPVYQSGRYAAYREALARLRGEGAVYPCRCSRKVLAEKGRPGAEGSVYPGTCRGRGDETGGGGADGAGPRVALRLRTEPEPVTWLDGIFGPQSVPLERDFGDFVVWRADGTCAYHLANVVDDDLDGITEVVRGHDLLTSTHRQAYLIDRLGLARPAWRHVPVAVNPQGQKLSKQTRAPSLAEDSGALPPGPAARWLRAGLRFLDHALPPELDGAGPAELLDWALRHWNPARIRPVATRPAPPAAG